MTVRNLEKVEKKRSPVLVAKNSAITQVSVKRNCLPRQVRKGQICSSGIMTALLIITAKQKTLQRWGNLIKVIKMKYKKNKYKNNKMMMTKKLNLMMMMRMTLMGNLMIMIMKVWLLYRKTFYATCSTR